MYNQLVPINLFLIVTCMIFETKQQNLTDQIILTLPLLFHEGTHGNFTFSFTSTMFISNVSFEIESGTRGIIFNVSMPNSTCQLISTDDICKRFKVQLKHHNVSGIAGINENIHYYEVTVTIYNISRNDASTYTCRAITGASKLNTGSMTYSIHVDIPPGKASCVEGTGETEEDLIILRCFASFGSDSRALEDFQCYQNGKPVLEHGTVHSNTSVKYKDFWVNETCPAMCCSVFREQQKDYSQCNDFVWTNHDNKNQSCTSNMNNSGLLTTMSMKTVQSSISYIPVYHTSAAQIMTSTETEHNSTETAQNSTSTTTTHIIGITVGVILPVIIIIIAVLIRFFCCTKKSDDNIRNPTVRYNVVSQTIRGIRSAMKRP